MLCWQCANNSIICYFTGDTFDVCEKDLNKVPEHVLIQEKDKMDILFQAHHLKHGDEDYKYDRQQNFGPAMIESGWDTDTSSSNEF